MSEKTNTEAPYEVGYRKPPADTRWRPGQSGHPEGRPRGSLGFRSALREAFMNNGLDYGEFVVERLTTLVQKAKSGDDSAATELVKWYEKYFKENDQ